VDACFIPFGDSDNLTQGKCTVCAKHTIDLEIILDTPDALLGDEAQVEARFSTFGDSANFDAR
jgi:hypothetical protein